VACRRQHLHQIADFEIRSQNAIAHDELNRNARISCLEHTDHLDGAIAGIADPEDDLKLGILLLAVTAKAIPDFEIYIFQGLKDGNRRQPILWQRRLPKFLAA